MKNHLFIKNLLQRTRHFAFCKIKNKLFLMNESVLSFIWRHQLLNVPVITVDNKKVEIFNFGEKNNGQGPDFLNARLSIDGVMWSGNVEIHVKSSDWFLHCHQLDTNYANVICHVVWTYDADVYYFHGDTIPTVELSKLIPDFLIDRYIRLMHSQDVIPCAKSISEVPLYVVYDMLDSCFFESFTAKKSVLNAMLSEINNDWDELCYRLILRNFGCKVNNEAFEFLAKALPCKFIMKYIDNPLAVDALLFGTASLLRPDFNDDYPKQLWREYCFYSNVLNVKTQKYCNWNLLRLRPANFPCVRIAQCSSFLQNDYLGLASFLVCNDLHAMHALFTAHINDYWTCHLMFDKPSTPADRTIGPDSINIILINAVLPMMFLYGNAKNNNMLCDKVLSIMEEIPPENNLVIRNWKRLNIHPKNAMHTQALLFLKKYYCDAKKCLQCKIGVKILKNK